MERILPLMLIRVFASFILTAAFGRISYGQCLPNIDFETGTFNGWTLYKGKFNTVNTDMNLLQVSGPVAGRHVIIYSGPGSSDNGTDYFGHFPMHSPNGSYFSVRLGNDINGGETEGMSYQFTIPVDAHFFSVTYNYAVVFQDPGHLAEYQPRLEIEVRNVTDGTSSGCSSFSFIASGGLPGFFKSDKHMGGDLTPVWCRDWSSNTINLDGNEGKTFNIFFKNADCVYGGHFGYAYIDVETGCGNAVKGSAYCPGDTAIDISAPAGYMSYEWYNNNFTSLLGTGQILHLSPPPPSGTDIFTVVNPYPGYGCIDTLSVHLEDTLTVHAIAGADQTSCDTIPLIIGALPVPGLVYHWTPATGLSNPNIANPIVNINDTITYTLTVTSAGGGCTDVDQVTIFKPLKANTLTLTGSASYCSGSGQSSMLHVNSADSIQWYKDGMPISGANQQDFSVTQSGSYSATLFSLAGGCSINTRVQRIDIYPTPVALFTINNNEQCFPGNSFNITNSSSISDGSMLYLWNFDDVSSSDSTSPSHHYSYPGNYQIGLTVSAAGGCRATYSLPIIVKPGADPYFSLQNICVSLPISLVNNTAAPGATVVNYLWDFGDNITSTLRTPQHAYSTDGTYTVKLSASTPECPVPLTKTAVVTITKPADALRYPDHPAIINFPEELQARGIGASALWTPAVNLSNPNVYNPYFKGATDQLYTIRLTTKEQCVTVDTLLVKPYKKIGINVPTAFTPNGDGINDYLKPILWGIKKVNYFRVFNRYGELLFEMKSDEPGWNGKVKGTLQNMQTVVWLIEAEDVDGKLHQEKGTSIMMR